MIAGVAERQLGNVTRGQLLAAGLGVGAIDHWLRCGRLHTRHRGVYALGHISLPEFSAEMAAVLACQPRALLSHASAAYLWGILRRSSSGIDVTVIARSARKREAINLHRVTVLDPHDTRRRHNIPVTSPARTLIDIAPSLADRELELALHEAIALKLLTINAVKGVLERYPRRRGSARLAALVTQPQDALTRSPAEEDLLKLIRRAGLPAPHLNAKIGPWSPDFYWPAHKLAVEVDGIEFHSSRVRIERDHRKDLDLRARGIDVMRFVPRQVKREPEMVLVTIAQELARRKP